MEGQSPQHEQIIAAIVAWAGQRIDLLPEENFPSGQVPGFWNTLKNTNNPVFQHIPDIRPPLDAYQILRYFETYASDDERKKFYDAQNTVLEKLDADLRGLKPPLQKSLNAIAEKYELKGNQGMRVLNYIRVNDALEENASLFIIRNYVSYARDIIANNNLSRWQEVGFALARSVGEFHGWDVTGGRAVQMLHAWMRPEDKEAVAKLLDERKAAEGRIKIEPRRWNAAEIAGLVREAFAESAKVEGSAFRRAARTQPAPRWTGIYPPKR